jgi:EmrB/QacA subfamily drug resistance transporter
MKKWGPLVILAAASFLMTLDQAVMNVSISQLVADLHTTVTSIQGIITLYSLIMAMFMVVGGKIGDLIGRRRAFLVGLVIYGLGSATTAIAPNVVVLGIGWSGLEGIGAALVLPALAALIAGNYEEKDRVTAYSVIGGVAGVAIAVGPIVGGWATTELSWRVVFVGEVIVVAAILLTSKLLSDAPFAGKAPKLDVVGALLVGTGLGALVFGILQVSTWGWLQPKDSPITPFGFSLTPFVIGAGGLLLFFFVQWQRRRVAHNQDPLIHLELFSVATLRAGLETNLGQMLILMGVFFTIPLYLQLVLGLDALETGVRMLPVSVAMFLASLIGARLTTVLAVRTIVQLGMGIVVVATLLLVGTIQPELNGPMFATAMGALGIGMGLVASQIGNVVQSSVDASGRGEAGGLQYTAQQLGSALGVALIGVIVLSGLVTTFTHSVNNNPAISKQVAQQVGVAVDAHATFVPASAVEAAAKKANLPAATVTELVNAYSSAQLRALKVGLLGAAAIGLSSMLFTAKLPSRKPKGKVLAS